MPRFFIDPAQIRDKTVYIKGEDVKHITKVLRLQAGDRITVCDGQGRDFLVQLDDLNSAEVTGTILEEQANTAEPPVDITLVQGLPKGEKMELIIQKCTELGVNRIIPVTMERSIVQLDAKKAGARRERWQRVAAEAAKQCRRGRIPLVDELCTWKGLWTKIPKGALIIMPWEAQQGQGLNKALAGVEVLAERKIYIIIGPEGGIAPGEAEEAHRQGALSVSLGPRILRTETASLAVLAIIMYQLGDLGGLSGDQQ
ncbi:MAG: 16S rRNA (uracil(1498)-N(3))-methyltransferase [Clostridia bacterium]|nr:16S rRNA (uracil(1498)-N(3))-methyltransferase [Clostridia bacterium]